jgi:hypothetical protein
VCPFSFPHRHLPLVFSLALSKVGFKGI